MAKISVIIPVYNVEKYLPRCLDSVLSQTFTDWEAVCVNDGSPDGSRKILQEYADRDCRIKIVDKPNGGLSDARNVGMQNASGEYVVFLDSDDFIHPQTFEISSALAERNGTDIVSWYKDPNYRNITIIRHALGLDTIDFRPSGFRKHFSPDRVKYAVTDNVYLHCTELSHPRGIRWPIKHFYVWRHLIRKSVIADVSFIKGITFEDFPWWSEVMLKNPSVTITRLPFYYYYPNFKSIDMSSSRMKKITNWCIGLERSYSLYRRHGDPRQTELWMRNCKWPVINKQIARHLEKFNPADSGSLEAKRILSALSQSGAFDDALTADDRKSVGAIMSFIGGSAV